MHLESDDFEDGGILPNHIALCVPDPTSHLTFGENRNPHLRWDDVPDGAQSFVVICVDSDAPSKRDDVNQEGKTVSVQLPRTNFYHWVLIDIGAHVREIAGGSCSQGVTLHGKAQQQDAPRDGLNDYTGWFAGDIAMEGQYFGYDGPCPPWNDELAHRYIFTVYALDIETVPVDGAFTAEQVLDAAEEHILDAAMIMGRYKTNAAIEY